MTAGALERVIRSRQARTAAAERCEFCAETVPVAHGHVLDTDTGEAMCACRACAILFNDEAAGRGRYRPIPVRRVRLARAPANALGVPVGLAYFVRHGDGRVGAHYPSPAGATQWEIDDALWTAVVAEHPELDGLASEVEALLVNVAKGTPQAWIVPIDDCFRLVATVRTTWRGLSGGTEVWAAIEQFFDGLGAATSPALR